MSATGPVLRISWETATTFSPETHTVNLLPSSARVVVPKPDPSHRYRRPYEGTGINTSAMQAYLEWEYGLVAQLERDGTHGFFVI